MKKGIVYLALSCLIAASMSLSSFLNPPQHHPQHQPQTPLPPLRQLPLLPAIGGLARVRPNTAVR